MLLISIFLHGLLAFSLPNNGSKKQSSSYNFPVSIITFNTKNTSKIADKPEPQVSKVKIIETAEKKATTENLNGDAIEPTIIYSTHPVYPEDAKANGHEAEFLITLIVDVAGNVENIDIKTVKGNLEWFETTLRQTFKTWKFSENSKTTRFSMPVSFLLDEQ